jgi:hypothetical protein
MARACPTVPTDVPNTADDLLQALGDHVIAPAMRRVGEIKVRREEFEASFLEPRTSDAR